MGKKISEKKISDTDQIDKQSTPKMNYVLEITLKKIYIYTERQ